MKRYAYCTIREQGHGVACACLLSGEAAALRIVTVGDSITAAGGWVDLLAARLPKHEFVNVARYGSYAIGWWPRGITSKYHTRFRPALPADVVTIMLGTMDAEKPVIPPDYEAAIDAIVTQMFAEGVRCIRLLTPPRSFGLNAKRDPWIELYRARLHKVADAHAESEPGRISVIEVHEILDEAHFQKDGLHPNAAGHARIADRVEKGLDLSHCERPERAGR